MKRLARILAPLAVAASGYLCLNYTREGAAPHHAEFAAEHGLPAPSRAIFFAGVALLLLGGVLLGRGLRRP